MQPTIKTLILNDQNMSYAKWYKDRGLNVIEDHMDLPGIFNLKKVGRQENESGQMIDFYSPDCIKAVRKLIKPGMYHSVVFCYDPAPYMPQLGQTGGFTEGNDDVYLGTWLTTVRKDGHEDLYANHEMKHTLTRKLDRMGIPVADIMDLTPIKQFDGSIKMIPYYKNELPDDPDSNHGRQWDIIAPYLSKLSMPAPLLKYGDRNFWVGVYQQQLYSLGYAIPITGYFGPITLLLTKKIQKMNGLNADGIVGPLTLYYSVEK